LDLHERRELNNGFGDSLAKAVEIVVTPLIFGALGWLLDGRLHTRPLFMLAFGLWTFGYVMWKALNGYTQKMGEHEAGLGLQRSPEDRHD